MTYQDMKDQEIKERGPIPVACQACSKVPTESCYRGPGLLHYHNHWDQWLCDDCFDQCCMEE